MRTDAEAAIVYRILQMYKHSGFLKPRTKAYLNNNRHRFFVTTIGRHRGGGVLSRKSLTPQTVELGAFGHIHPLSQPAEWGVHTVESFMASMTSQGYTRFISL